MDVYEEVKVRQMERAKRRIERERAEQRAEGVKTILTDTAFVVGFVVLIVLGTALCY